VFERGFELLATHQLSFDLQCCPSQLPAGVEFLTVGVRVWVRIRIRVRVRVRVGVRVRVKFREDQR
jgi:hypothetical protein